MNLNDVWPKNIAKKNIYFMKKNSSPLLLSRHISKSVEHWQQVNNYIIVANWFEAQWKKTLKFTTTSIISKRNCRFRFGYWNIRIRSFNVISHRRVWLADNIDDTFCNDVELRSLWNFISSNIFDDWRKFHITKFRRMFVQKIIQLFNNDDGDLIQTFEFF